MLEIYSGIDPVILQLLNILQYGTNDIIKMIVTNIWIILIWTIKMTHNVCMFFMFDKSGKTELSPLKSLITLPHKNDKKDKSLIHQWSFEVKKEKNVKLSQDLQVFHIT